MDVGALLFTRSIIIAVANLRWYTATAGGGIGLTNLT